MRKGPGRVFFLAALSLAITPAALAQTPDWRVMMEMGKPGDRSLLLIDARSVTTPARGMRTVQVSTFYATVQTDDIKPYNVIRLTYRFDCAAKTGQRIREVVLLDDKLVSQTDAVNPMAPVKPDTLPGDLLGPACTGNFNAFPRITAATPALERKRRFGK